VQRLVGCLVCASLALGCQGADDLHYSPSTEVTYAVSLNVPSGLRVTVDGVDTTSFYVRYEDHDAALASPLFHLETWSDDTLLDAIEIGFGACEAECPQTDLGCEAGHVVHEVAEALSDANGLFLGASNDPRSWRGVGCLSCVFEDGTHAVVCT
jgi:hypothetical protein